jgi:hypothetical protein
MRALSRKQEWFKASQDGQAVAMDREIDFMFVYSHQTSLHGSPQLWMTCEIAKQ